MINTIIGIYETMKTFGYIYQDEFGNTYYKDEAYNFGKKIFKVIQNIKDTFVLDKNYMVNIEAVPKKWAHNEIINNSL